MNSHQKTQRKIALLEMLANCLRRNEDGDTESIHMEADAALLDYINDKDITKAFHAIYKWYA